MIYLLIDTSSAIGSLISDSEYNHNLKDLMLWKKKHQVELLVPSICIEEWETRKKVCTDKIDKLIAQVQKSENLHKTAKILFEERSTTLKNELYQQIKDYRTLLDSGIAIEITDHAKSRAIEHFEKGLKPFKSGQDNLNRKKLKDPKILFAALDFAQEQGIDEVHFLTNNHNDFAEDSSLAINLHPDYLAYYRSLNVKYYCNSSDWREAMFNLGLEGTESELKTGPNNGSQKSKSSGENNKRWKKSKAQIRLVDPGDHFLDQTYSLFKNYLYEQVAFVPHHVLSSHQPIQKRNGTFIRDFWLRTDNSEFQQLFTSVEWGESKIQIKDEDYFKNVKDPIKKLEFVRDSLENNLVYFISDDNNHNRSDIRKLNNESCNCLLCQLNNGRLKQVLNILSKESKDIKDLILHAFVYYRIGDYVNSARKLIRALEFAKREGLVLLSFLINYNLSNLESSIPFFWEEKLRELRPAFEEIDLEYELCEYRDPITKPIAQWIDQEKFLISAERHLKDIVRTYRSYALNPPTGAYFSSDNWTNLIFQFAKAQTFVDKNFVIFDGFKEYTNLLELFAEGIYAAHSLPKSISIRMPGFNDWVLLVLLEHANSKDLKRLFRQYKLREVTYLKTDAVNNFIDRLTRSLDRFGSNFKLIQKKLGKETSFRDREIARIMSGLVLAGQLNLTNKECDRIARALVSFIYHAPNHSSIDTIEYFLVRKGNQIKGTVLKKLLLSSIESPRLHSFDLHGRLADICVKNDITLKFTKSNFELFRRFSLDHCKKCNRKHGLDFLLDIHMITDNHQEKVWISNKVNNALKQEYDYRLFCSAVVFNVIDVDDRILEIAIEKAVPRIRTRGRIQTVNRGHPSERYQPLSMLINMCFKARIDLSHKRFDSLRNISPFYDWLLDMDGFDYGMFDYSWLNEVRTIYIWRRMLECGPLRAHLENYLEKGESFLDDRFNSRFVHIYYRKNWHRW